MNHPADQSNARMLSRKLTTGELDILHRVQKLYGKLYHERSDCFESECDQICLFVRTQFGEPVYEVSLTEMSRKWDAMQSIFIEQHFTRMYDPDH